ncbi:MAG: alpha/beta hydrolase [Promethearchaeota archaeon]
MLTKIKKYFILIVIDLLISVFIWHVNASWGNSFWICLILSTTTFLIVFTPFQIYFSWRDIWFDRWEELYLKDLEISKVKIKVEDGNLYANILVLKDQEAILLKNTIVLISPGFSDTKKSLQYLYYPLAHEGYVVLAYDARGIGESKKTGKRNDFIKRLEDFKTIIRWIRTHNNYKKFKIYSIGMSIGAITVLCAGFNNKDLEKIVAISSISKYYETLKTSRGMVKLSYRLKGINLKFNKEENQLLSPYLVIKKGKANLPQEEWKEYSKRVFLIHARNDKIIPFKNFKENRAILELPAENILILNKGGHIHKKNELALVGATLRFFNE